METMTNAHSKSKDAKKYSRTRLHLKRESKEDPNFRKKKWSELLLIHQIKKSKIRQIFFAKDDFEL